MNIRVEALFDKEKKRALRPIDFFEAIGAAIDALPDLDGADSHEIQAAISEARDAWISGEKEIMEALWNQAFEYLGRRKGGLRGLEVLRSKWNAARKRNQSIRDENHRLCAKGTNPRTIASHLGRKYRLDPNTIRSILRKAD